MYMIVKTFSGDESGATAIEYGLVASLIAMVVLAALSATGDGVMAKWQYVMEKVTAALNGGGGGDGGGGDG